MNKIVTSFQPARFLLTAASALALALPAMAVAQTVMPDAAMPAPPASEAAPAETSAPSTAAAPATPDDQMPTGATPVVSATRQAASGQVAANPASGEWDADAQVQLEQSLNAHLAMSQPTTRPEEMKSLIFTAWQYALLQEAKQLFITRPPSAGEASADPNAPKPAGPREIALGGISFVNGGNWTVWLNNERIKPDAIPKAVLDIRVKKDHVDLKWYDISTDLIYPVRLRPHQRFNLDSRMFLPGTGI